MIRPTRKDLYEKATQPKKVIKKYMTPKEKAEELAEKYQELVFDMVDMSNCEGYHSTSVSCAAIAVEEVLANLVGGSQWYWNEVKRELEKL